MTLYEVYLANGETVHVNAEGVVDALGCAEVQFNIQAIDAYLYEPCECTNDGRGYLLQCNYCRNRNV